MLRSDVDREAYLRMCKIRGFGEAVTALITAGEVPGACHSSVGQEAAIVGACMALRNDDYVSGTRRSHGHLIGNGALLRPLMAKILGKATGVRKGRGGSMHLTDKSVGSIGESAVVGGGIPIATGAALTAQVKGTDQVALTFFGDGASHEGVLAECLNMAAARKLPVMLVEIETSKSTQEMEAPASGALTEFMLPEGEKAEVRTHIASIETD